MPPALEPERLQGRVCEGAIAAGYHSSPGEPETADAYWHTENFRGGLSSLKESYRSCSSGHAASQRGASLERRTRCRCLETAPCDRSGGLRGGWLIDPWPLPGDGEP